MLNLELLSTKLILGQFYLNILAVIAIYGMQSLQNINLLRTKTGKLLNIKPVSVHYLIPSFNEIFSKFFT